MSGVPLTGGQVCYRFWHPSGCEGERMSTSLSPMFLADLAQVYATVRPPAPSAALLSDLKQIAQEVVAQQVQGMGGLDRASCN